MPKTELEIECENTIKALNKAIKEVKQLENISSTKFYRDIAPQLKEIDERKQLLGHRLAPGEEPGDDTKENIFMPLIILNASTLELCESVLQPYEQHIIEIRQHINNLQRFCNRSLPANLKKQLISKRKEGLALLHNPGEQYAIVKDVIFDKLAKGGLLIARIAFNVAMESSLVKASSSNDTATLPAQMDQITSQEINERVVHYGKDFLTKYEMAASTYLHPRGGLSSKALGFTALRNDPAYIKSITESWEEFTGFAILATLHNLKRLKKEIDSGKKTPETCDAINAEMDALAKHQSRLIGLLVPAKRPPCLAVLLHIEHTTITSRMQSLQARAALFFPQAYEALQKSAPSFKAKRLPEDSKA